MATSGNEGRNLAQVVRRHRYCAVRYPAALRQAANAAPNGARLLRERQYTWPVGSVIRYWFYDRPAAWAGAAQQRDVVRKAFGIWAKLGLGIRFEEVGERRQAQVRIAFLQGDGSWSYVGTDVLTRRPDSRTMNFGWDLLDDPDEGLDTALHEIGHTLGFPHEHQNPFAGIVWDEEAVYRAMARPDNNWDRPTTYANILQKIQVADVDGSRWDPNSIMHYAFEKGLILKPAKYARGLTPAGGLSRRDRQWARALYPPVAPAAARPVLHPFRTTALGLVAGQQRDFAFRAQATRMHTFRIVGDAEVAMALFRKGAEAGRPLAGSAGTAAASVKATLNAGETYVLRVRLRRAPPDSMPGVMVA